MVQARNRWVVLVAASVAQADRLSASVGNAQSNTFMKRLSYDALVVATVCQTIVPAALGHGELIH